MDMSFFCHPYSELKKNGSTKIDVIDSKFRTNNLLFVDSFFLILRTESSPVYLFFCLVDEMANNSETQTHSNV
jgi:hypothetical protein